LEEFPNDPSQGSDNDIEQMTVDNNALTFDLHSLKKVQEIIKSTKETEKELLEGDELFEDDSIGMEIFEEKFDEPLVASDQPKKFTNCVIIDNDNDQNIIKRCNNVEVQRVEQLS
ncbi:13653_t:CDS:1, partial [Cetraspora pellucida]